MRWYEDPRALSPSERATMAYFDGRPLVARGRARRELVGRRWRRATRRRVWTLVFCGMLIVATLATSWLHLATIHLGMR